MSGAASSPTSTCSIVASTSSAHPYGRAPSSRQPAHVGCPAGTGPHGVGPVVGREQAARRGHQAGEPVGELPVGGASGVTANRPAAGPPTTGRSPRRPGRAGGPARRRRPASTRLSARPGAGAGRPQRDGGRQPAAQPAYRRPWSSGVANGSVGGSSPVPFRLHLAARHRRGVTAASTSGARRSSTSPAMYAADSRPRRRPSEPDRQHEPRQRAGSSSQHDQRRGHATPPSSADQREHALRAAGAGADGERVAALRQRVRHQHRHDRATPAATPYARERVAERGRQPPAPPVNAPTPTATASSTGTTSTATPRPGRAPRPARARRPARSPRTPCRRSRTGWPASAPTSSAGDHDRDRQRRIAGRPPRRAASARTAPPRQPSSPTPGPSAGADPPPVPALAGDDRAEPVGRQPRAAAGGTSPPTGAGSPAVDRPRRTGRAAEHRRLAASRPPPAAAAPTVSAPIAAGPPARPPAGRGVQADRVRRAERRPGRGRGRSPRPVRAAALRPARCPRAATAPMTTASSAMQHARPGPGPGATAAPWRTRW